MENKEFTEVTDEKYIPLVLTAHEDGYTASREIPMEIMLNPEAMKMEYERLREVLDAYIESDRSPRFLTKEAAERGDPRVWPIIEVCTTTGTEKRVNPTCKAAKFTVNRVPVERGDESTQ